MKFLLTFFVTIGLSCAYAQTMPQAKSGILNASNYDFSASPLHLNGEWFFYWNELLPPYQAIQEKERASYTDFPSVWSQATKGQGFATYQLTLILNRQFKEYSIEMPSTYSAYSLWINGNLVAKNGSVGTNRKTSLAQWLPKLITITPSTDTLSLVLQISNFSHSKGGIKDPLVLGRTKDLTTKRAFAETVNTVLVAVLAFVGLFFLNIYLFVKKQRAILYFALVCLVWSVRSLFSELYLAIQWMPWFDWELAAKIEYLTIYLEVAFAMLFIGRLYPLDTNRIIKAILVYPNFLFVFITMTTYAVFYTQFLNVYLSFAGLVILYVVFVILRAIVFERYGAWFSVLGIMAGVAAFTYNILSYEGVFEFNPLFYYSGWLLIVSFMAIALAYQLSPKAKKFNTTDTLTLDDFMKSLE
jgi:7TM diverse intracellular signalling